MRTSQKKGLYKSLLTIFIVVLAGILMLTGCSDKEARQSATNAATGAANAQTAADAAKAAADAAQAAADAAANKAQANSDAIAGLPDDEAVAASIKKILAEYVEGELAEDSILSKAEVTALLGEYVKMSALSSYVQTTDLADYAKAADLAALASALAAAKTELTTELAKYCLKSDTLTKAEIAEDIADAVEGVLKTSDVNALIATALNNYYTNSQIDAKLAALAGSIGDSESLMADIREIAEAKVKEHEDAFEDATDYIEAEGIPAIDAEIASYKANAYLYTAEVLNRLIAKLENSKLLILRMQTVDDAKDYVEDVIDAVAEEKTIAQLLADALDAVTRPILVPIGTEVHVADNEITKCENLLTTAMTQITDPAEFAALINAYVDEDVTRDLQNETVTFRAYYNLMLTAQTNAPAVVAAINAIPFYNAANMDYNDLKVDDCVWNSDHTAIISGDRFDFTEALNNSVNYIAGVSWYDTYMGQFGEAFEDDDQANLERLISNHDKYEAAIARNTELGTLDVDAAAMNGDTFEMLKDAGYFVYDPSTMTTTTTGKALYSYYETLKDQKELIDDWCDEQGVTVKTNPIPYYNDLAAALDYAEDMNDLFEEATTPETGIIAILDAIIAKLPGLALSNKAEVEAARTALDAFEAKFAGDTDNFEAVVNYIPEGSDLYEGSTRIAEFEKCETRIAGLELAKAEADLINADIAALASVADINSMAAIRALRNRIVTWFNDWTIVPEAYVNDVSVSPILYWIHNPASIDVELDDDLMSGDIMFVQENFDMIDIEDLDTIFNLVNDALKEAIEGAKPVMDLIAALKVDDPKLLYQYAAKEEARKAYDAWIMHYKINNPDLSAYDFGEGNEDVFNQGKSVLIESYIKYNNFSMQVETTYGTAKIDYAAFASDLTAALSTITPTTLLLSDGQVILPLYASAIEWFNKYLDPKTVDPETGAVTRYYDAVINSLIDILPQADYEAICALKEAYDALLEEAEEDAAAVKDLVDALNDPATIYDGDKIAAAEDSFADWATDYNINTSDFDSDDVPESLKYMKDVLADLEAIRAGYDALVASLVAQIATVKASLVTINAATLDIYSRETLKNDLAVFFDWAEDAGLNAEDMEANNFVAAFDGIDDATIAAFGASPELAAFETKYKALLDIESDKQDETADVIELINALGTLNEDGTVTLVEGFNTANRAATDAAKAAYDAWLNGTALSTGAVNLAAQVAYDERCQYIVTNTLVLTTAIARLAEIDAKLAAAIAAINAVSNPASLVNMSAANPFANLETAIAAADSAVADFYAINGNTNAGGLKAIHYQTLYNAKAYLTYYKFVYTNNLASTLPLTNEDLLLGAYGTLFTAYRDVCATFAGLTDEGVANGTNDTLNNRINTFANELVSLLADYNTP